MTKMTNAIALATAIEAMKAQGSDAEAIAKVEHILEQIVKKNSAERKPSAKQVANASKREVLLSEMEEGRAYTITQMTKEIPCVLGESVSKVSYLVRTLKDEGLVHREVIKGTAYFTRAEVEG